jgi:ferric-dicitrate binding protein FerR (iron transport regulator)
MNMDKDTIYARWLSNEITEEELEFLRKDGAIEDLEKILSTTKSLKVPAYDKVKGLEKLKTQRLKEKTTSKNRNKLWFVAIVLFLLLALTLFSYLNKDSKDVMIANNGKTENLNLIDGSSIIINDGSKIMYNEDTWLEARNLDLVGEAFFDVEKGSPFMVQTKNGSIEVLGTEFNVRSWGSKLIVECYEGSVKVRSSNNQTILKAKEAVYTIDGILGEKETITNVSPLWTEQKSRFIDENINEVFAELERQYDIIVKAPKMTKRFSGIFMHNNLDAALLNVCKPLDLNFSISEDKKEVIIE